MVTGENGFVYSLLPCLLLLVAQTMHLSNLRGKHDTRSDNNETYFPSSDHTDRYTWFDWLSKYCI